MQIRIHNTDSAPSHLLADDVVLKARKELEGVHHHMQVFCHSEFSWTEYPTVFIPKCFRL